MRGMAGRRPPSSVGAMPAALRVLVVDDHAVVRRGVVAYLDVLDDVEVAGEAADGRDALDAAGRPAPAGTLPDVVLMDLQMPRMDGVAATAEIARRFPSVRVVVLTSFGENERVHAALQQGAAGYLLKDAGAAEVAAALYAAARDEVFLDAAVARRLAQEIRGPRSGLARPHRPGARDPRSSSRRHVQQGDRGRARDQRAHGPDPRQQRARQAEPDLPHPGRARRRQGGPGCAGHARRRSLGLDRQMGAFPDVRRRVSRRSADR